MTLKLKSWTGLGFGTVLFGIALAACTDHANTPHAEPHKSEVHVTESDEQSEIGHTVGSLPLEHRLAFMTGHVKAGLALYRAGAPEQAAPHLLHPVSETHKSERQGLEALGFKASLFETVSEALEKGRPASEIEQQLTVAEENLDSVARKAGGDTAGIIRFLMTTIVEEYSIAITDGVVTDPGEYQDAFGFAQVAKKHAENLDANHKEAALKEINDLISLWPHAPIPPESPTPVEQIIEKASMVQFALPSE